MFRKILCLAATALLTQAASANVVYTWQQVEHADSMPEGLHLELTFTDAAVAAKALTLNVENRCMYGDCSEQQDSLVSLRYWYAGADGTQEWNLIDYRYQDEMQFGLQRLSMALQFEPDGYLSGRIMANDGWSDFTMESDGTVFSMLWAHSDQPAACGDWRLSCAGERGQLRSSLPGMAHPLDQALPEPGSLAMLAAGGLAGWFARRRRSKAEVPSSTLHG
jgi:hypothetical protein